MFKNGGGKIKGGGCELLSHSRATVLSPGWGGGYMLTKRAGGHRGEGTDEGIKEKKKKC